MTGTTRAQVIMSQALAVVPLRKTLRSGGSHPPIFAVYGQFRGEDP